MDVAMRIGRLPDNALVARRVGEVRWVVCASGEGLLWALSPIDMSLIPSGADMASQIDDVRFGPIVLKKSFLADDPNFSGPLMPSTRGDVRDHIDLNKRNREPSYWS